MDQLHQEKSLKVWFGAPFLLKWIEPLLFGLFLIGNLFVIWSLDVYSTLDGPAHLYNANLLNHIQNNPFLQEYFTEAPFYLPNYLTDVVLAKLMLFTTPLIAEKLFLSMIVLFLPLSFRTLLKAIKSEGSHYTYLIFFLLPFCKLFNLGFFNFVSAFIFFNYAIALFVWSSKEGSGWKPMLLSLFNAIVLFYAHAMVFAMAVLVILLMSIIQYVKAGKKLWLLLGKLSLIYLIPGILFLLFFFNNDVQDYKGDMLPYKKVIALVTFDPGVLYMIETETVNSTLAMVALLFMCGSAVALRFSASENKRRFQVTDIFIFIALGCIYLIFHSTDGLFGGMFMHRLNFIIYYFTILWLLCHLDYFRFHYVVGMVFVIVAYVSLAVERNKTLELQSEVAMNITKAGTYLKENSLVHVVSLQDAWFQSHFSNYLATSKPMVLTENYEATLPWFPLKWSDKVSPTIHEPLGKGMSELNYPDYVFVLGNIKKLKDVKNKNSKEFIDQRTKEIYCPKDSNFILYKVIKGLDAQ